MHTTSCFIRLFVQNRLCPHTTLELPGLSHISFSLSYYQNFLVVNCWIRHHTSLSSPYKLEAIPRSTSPFHTHLFHSYLPGTSLSLSLLFLRNPIMTPRLLPFATLLGISILLPLSAAHSWIKEPLTYNRRFVGKCRGSECDRACPQTRGVTPNNTQEAPEATYMRGQTIRVGWMKNNHRGGFARMSMVPVKSMWERTVHTLLAFYYTCWDSHIHNCGSGFESCGSDKNGEAMQTTVTIPTCLPDGDYVMGWVWYGGLHSNRKTGKFADYFSCAHVRISGGAALTQTCTARFVNGNTGESVRDGKCQSGSDQPGYCKENDDCLSRPASFMVPRPFASGQSKTFTLDDVNNAASGAAPPPPPPSDPAPAASMTPTTTPSPVVALPPETAPSMTPPAPPAAPPADPPTVPEDPVPEYDPYGPYYPLPPNFDDDSDESPRRRGNPRPRRRRRNGFNSPRNYPRYNGRRRGRRGRRGGGRGRGGFNRQVDMEQGQKNFKTKTPVRTV